MLPFLKDKTDVAASMPPETKRVSDGSDYELLDAVAEDMLSAFKAGDRGRLKSALQSFAEYLQEMDEEQDEQLMQGM